ncbi:uncharacterized protein LACBIDRAFT_318397 [Laccaria bicolor S238N-H82]|uniref:Predicted protein n=1 Tax=Laccaria bicolor (strain S238N-H82 / ATCC MYA-4686) TaxID=486041 RepID=B0D6N0_LACBS|nr:uncharacterized protein LACBIDRAFT_318397 [Laccaria bicolor S238N-H82]EDR09982.1 predicted protein [Laccaria bicolor S238N-H82]|eukprot:XP_001879367.1 predicted protein [Laccaria bicolor S238N-H82]
MDPPPFPFSDNELTKIGVLNNEGVPVGPAAHVLEMMKKRPDLIKPSLFALQCLSLQNSLYRRPSSPPSLNSPTFSNPSNSTDSPTVTLTNEATVVSEHAPDTYERMCYYTGNNSDHPKLVYRSDALTTPFLKPVGRFARVPVKSVSGVFDTPLNKVWDTVDPQIRDIMKAHKIKWVSIGKVRFFTHGPIGEEEKGSLGPVVIVPSAKWEKVPDSKEGSVEHECALLNGYFNSSKTIV